MAEKGGDEFFDRLNAWSIWKHRILAKYLHIWVAKLGSNHKELAFVDTCAGAGIYGDGSEGSPVLAAKWNDHPLLAERGGALHVHACETSPDTVLELRRNLAKWGNRAIIYDEAFETAMPTILAATRSMPTLFFVDPYGGKEVDFETLKPLLTDKRNASTEVIVRIDPGLLSRFAGWVIAEEKNAKHRKTAESFGRRLASYNINVEAIAEAGYQPECDALFGDYLKGLEETFKYVLVAPIRSSYNASPKYYLVYGTQSPHGASALNNVLSTTEDELFDKTEEENAPGQISLFGPATRPVRKTVDDAKNVILATLKGQTSVVVIEIFAQLAKQLGPDLREKHYRAAIKELIKSGKIERVTGNGTLNESDRLKLKPN